MWLEINLSKFMEAIYEDIYRIMLKYIKGDITNWRKISDMYQRAAVIKNKGVNYFVKYENYYE